LGICAIVAGAHFPCAVLLALMAPLVIDGFGQYYGKWKSTNARRLFSGFFFGFSILLFAKLLLLTGFAHGQKIGSLIKPLLG
jgi:uncharacterized membrane protein